MPRRNFLLILAYDGTEFMGWQRLLGSARSVQAEVEAALGRSLEPGIEVTGAGRTDAGVHAEGQAASFHSRTSFAAEEIAERLNRELPPDLVCRSCREVDPRFHARYRAKAKLYRYRLHVADRPDPFVRRYSLHVARPLDVDAMRAAGEVLVGEHDFRAFTNAKGVPTTRSLDGARVERKGDFVDILFSAPGFLTNQARIMASALLEAGLGRLDAGDLRGLLEGRQRSEAPGMLGAYGLCLVEVRF